MAAATLVAGAGLLPRETDMPLIDTNAHLFRWPFRRVANDTAPALVTKLKQLGITEAWAGNYDALLHCDL